MSAAAQHLTPVQRVVRRRLHGLAGKTADEALDSGDWGAFCRHHASARPAARLLGAIPCTRRCRLCGTPFDGPGARLLGPLGYRPSRKNPTICATCIELAPPGGTVMEVGVMFADIRGFTRLTASADHSEVHSTVRRLYKCAHSVLFPDAIIGIDFGEAFVGTIGDRWLSDFTAVGRIVNSAAALQQAARPGEILLSRAVAFSVGGAEPLQVRLKGEDGPVTVYRFASVRG